MFLISDHVVLSVEKTDSGKNGTDGISSFTIKLHFCRIMNPPLQFLNRLFRVNHRSALLWLNNNNFINLALLSGNSRLTRASAVNNRQYIPTGTLFQRINPHMRRPPPLTPVVTLKWRPPLPGLRHAGCQHQFLLDTVAVSFWMSPPDTEGFIRGRYRRRTGEG